MYPPLAALLLTSMAPTHAADDVEALVAEALEANARISSRRERVDELEELARAAGAWPDPMVGVEYSNAPVDSFALDGHPMAGLQLRLQQTAHLPGWSGAQRAVAEERIITAGHAVGESEVAVRRAVEKVYWELARTRVLEQVTRDHLARTEELLSAVRSRYEVGRAGQHAVLRLEVLRDRLQDDLGDYLRADRSLTSRLGGLLSRSGLSVETPTELEPVAAPSDTAALVARARELRPTLERLDAELRTHEAAAKLARVDGRPDVTVWLGYRVRTVTTDTDPGTDLASVGVSVPLPLGTGRRASAARAGHLEAADGVRERQRADLDGVTADLGAIVAAWERAADKAHTYDETLVPGARAALETTLTDYTVDRADFSSLFDAEVVLLDLDRARIKAAVDTHLLEAEARAVVGGPLFGGSQ